AFLITPHPHQHGTMLTHGQQSIFVHLNSSWKPAQTEKSKKKQRRRTGWDNLNQSHPHKETRTIKKPRHRKRFTTRISNIFPQHIIKPN
ncbi:MAG: hypothetical protein ACM3UL_01810, partial [Ignavibacteria bacterium]